MKYFITKTIFAILILFSITASGQCPAGTDSVFIEVITTNRGYEVYWQLVPDTNQCGNGTIYAGGNLAQMDCNGANANVATPGSGYASNDTIMEGPFCLTPNAKYTIRYIDDSGASDNWFIVYIKGLPVYRFHSLANTEEFTFDIIEPLDYNVAVKKISTISYVTTNPVSISGKLFNYSTNTIQSMDVHYTIDNGTVYTDHVSGLNFTPYSQRDFIHSTLFTPPANATYEVKVWVDNLDGNADMDHSNDTIYKKITTGNPVPLIIDQYLLNTPTIVQIADVSNQLYRPSDLDFHTILSRNELWVANMSDITTYGSTVTIYNAGTPNQTSLWRQDSNADHFMLMTSALAFADNTNFATSAAVLDAHLGSGHFAGPALWSSDSLIYCQPAPGPLGSHIDMLHQSPWAMGVAAETENRFWVNDGYNQCITWYDFVEDHGPGFDEHTDGLVRRYQDFTLNRINDTIPNHLVLDANGMLYVVDNGNARVIKMDTHTGSVTGSFSPYAEYITEHSIVTGTTWSNYITTGLVQPSGIDVIGNRLIVSDFSNGDIIIYDNTTATGTEMGRIHTGSPGVAGVKVGPDGKIWFVNQLESKVFRIDGVAVGVEENVAKSAFRVYPNPASDKLYISTTNVKNNNTDFSIRITNLLGEVVYTSALDRSDLSVDVHQFNEGVYFVTLSDNSVTETFPVIISRSSK